MARGMVGRRMRRRDIFVGGLWLWYGFVVVVFDGFVWWFRSVVLFGSSTWWVVASRGSSDQFGYVFWVLET